MANEKMIGILDLHSAPSLGPLTSRRSMASVPFLGRYCIMDFTLSNMSNSDIDYIGVLAKGNIRSLSKHIGSGSSWRFNTKTGKVQILYNEPTANMLEYNTDVANIIENWWFIEESRADYILIAPVHIIHRMDYTELLKAHIESKAKCTLVYTHIRNDDDYKTMDYLTLDQNNKVKGISEKPFGSKKDAIVNMGVSLFNKSYLIEILKRCQETSKFFNILDFFKQNITDLDVDGYEYKGELFCYIDSFYDYYKHSLEALDTTIASKFFSPSWPIFTKSFDAPPAIYGNYAKVQDSYIANGAQINGTVKHSILGRGVIVEKNAVIENCIILSNSHIYQDSKVTNAILDNEVSVLNTKNVEGKPKYPLYVKRGDQI